MDSRNFEELERDFKEHRSLSKEQYIVLNDKIDKAVSALNTNTAASSEMLLLYDNLKKAFRVLGWVEKGASAIIKVGGACAVFWSIWKFVISQAIEQIKVGLK